MELKVSRKEVEALLLDAISAKFPGLFNRVKVDARYTTLDSAEFYYEEEQVEKNDESDRDSV